MTHPEPDESALQQQVIRYLRLSLPAGSLVWSTPNEARRTPANASRLKAMGLTAGVEDISILVHPHGFYFAIELKTSKGRQTEPQRQREIDVNLAGGRYFLCRSIDDVHAALVSAGVAMKARLR